ncbi:leucine-rich repeats and immunoglobulin-like domains protein 3 [Elysia marginata]|uniref:Leucine-rich repeats and immunoglobulin-like domains protein 3 n=1 Tax=Elysia marginata TaxID=1093978 RepID=A0AAV4G8S8_9GAST|nr:leucine-rich repeats and immunoglobulin-like domains protein 3 [Elysia marginata]
MAACPSHCACSKEDGGGEEINCSGKRLVTLPKTPKSTVILDLSHNMLGPVMNATFTHHMSKLEVLDLSYNSLDRLFTCTLSSMEGLKRLNLRGNKLTDIPENLFDDASKLESLDISNNQLTSLAFDFLNKLTHLKSLDASSNKFTDLTLGARFQVPKRLAFLDLSFNNFGDLSEGAFHQAREWNSQVGRTLKLQQCGLENIRNETLSKIPKLRSLDVSGNPGVSAETWGNVLPRLTSLEDLSLADCGLTSLHPIFSRIDNTALKSLNVSNNSISDIPVATSQNEFTLEALDMSHNEMSTVTGGFIKFKNLVRLNISYNVLTAFKGENTEQMNNLHTLWLSNNMLSGENSVSVSSFPLRELVLHTNQLTKVPLPSNTSALKILDVHSNKITEIPDIEEPKNLQHVDFSHNHIKSLQAYLFKDAHLIKTARFSHNEISSVNDNAFLPHSPLVLDLSHNSLADLNTPHWVATQEISLASNQLTTLNPGTFYGMKGLMKLDISRNKLVYLHENLFQHLDTLAYMDMSHNQLAGKNEDGMQEKIYWTRLFKNLVALKTLRMGHNSVSTLEPDTLNRLESLEYLYLDNNKLATIYPILFRDRPDLKALDLSGNPFDCSCDLLAFRDWLSRTRITLLGIEVIGANSTYNCSSPDSRKGFHVKGWTPDQFECNQSTFYLIVFGSLAVFLIIAAVVGVGLLRIYRQWRAKMKEQKRRRARILRELEEVQRGKYGRDKEEELVLVSREIAAEIEDALERKKKLGRKHHDTKVHRGGYIPWPIRGRKGYKQAEELEKLEDDPVPTRSWGDGLDRRERRDVPQPGIGERNRESSDWPLSNGGPAAHIEKPQREREVPRVVKLDQHYPYVVREAVPVAEKVEWVPARPRYQDDRYLYRPEPVPRQSQQPPYVPYNQDNMEPAPRPTVWTTANDYRPNKYWTLPSRSSREEVRYGDDIRVNYRPENQQQYQGKPRSAGVRFENPRYYPDPRPGSYEYWRRYHGNRSLSQSYLAADYDEDGQRGRDRAQRQYESLEPHQRGREGLGQRSTSQPALAQANTSGWL